MYTIKEIKKLKEFEEDDFDVDKKMFFKEIQRSKREKYFALLGLVLFVVTWLLYLRYEMQAILKGEKVLLSLDGWFWSLIIA